MSNPFSNSWGASTGATCSVRSGAHTNTYPAGRRVSEYRALMGAATHIEAGAKAFLGNQELSEDYEVGAGESIVFTRKTGEKG